MKAWTSAQANGGKISKWSPPPVQKFWIRIWNSLSLDMDMYIVHILGQKREIHENAYV